MGDPIKNPRARKQLEELVADSEAFYKEYFRSPKFQERAERIAPWKDAGKVADELLSRIGYYDFVPRIQKQMYIIDEETGEKIPQEPDDPNIKYMADAYQEGVYGPDKLYFREQSMADITPGVRDAGTIKDRGVVMTHELAHDLMSPNMIDGASGFNTYNMGAFQDMMFRDAKMFADKPGLFGGQYDRQDEKEMLRQQEFRAAVDAALGTADFNRGILGEARSYKPEEDYVYDDEYTRDMQYLANRPRFYGGELPSGRYQDEHSGTAFEMIPDIYALRYLLKKKGIHDAGTEDFTQEHLEKMFSDPEIKDEMIVRRLYEEILKHNQTKNSKERDKMFIDMMNTIAATGGSDNSNLA